MSFCVLINAVACSSLQGSQRLERAASGDTRRSRFRTATIGPAIFTASSHLALIAGASRLVSPHDHVLEIGSQLGEVTRCLADKASSVHGVDMERELQGKSGRTASFRSHSSPEEAGLTGVRFTLLDPWDTRALLQAIGADEEPTFAVIDLNQIVGNDLPLEALALARQLGKTFPSLTNVIIKSGALDKLQRQLTTLPELRAEKGRAPPPSWLPRIVATRGVADYRAAALEVTTSAGV